MKKTKNDISISELIDLILKGIGRQLFALAVAEARNAGAKELYISACSSEETVNFYKAMGAKVTDDLIPEIAEAELYDIQMTFDLKGRYEI